MISNLAAFFSDLKVGLKTNKAKKSDNSLEQKRRRSLHRTFWYGNDHNISASCNGDQASFGCLGRIVSSEESSQIKKNRATSIQSLDKACKKSLRLENDGVIRNTVSMLDLNEVKKNKKISKKDKHETPDGNFGKQIDYESKAKSLNNGKIIFRSADKLNFKNHQVGFAKFSKEQKEEAKELKQKHKEDRLKRGYSWRKAYKQGAIPIETNNYSTHFARVKTEDRFIMDKSSSSSSQNTSNETRQLRLNSIPNQYSSMLQISVNAPPVVKSLRTNSIINETSQINSNISECLKSNKENKSQLKTIKSLDIDFESLHTKKPPSRKSSLNSQISDNINVVVPPNLSSSSSSSSCTSTNSKKFKKLAAPTSPPPPPPCNVTPFSSLLRKHQFEDENKLPQQNVMQNYHPTNSLVDSYFSKTCKTGAVKSTFYIEGTIKEHTDEPADSKNMISINYVKTPDKRNHMKQNNLNLKQINPLQQFPHKNTLTTFDQVDNHMPNVMSTPALSSGYSNQKDKQPTSCHNNQQPVYLRKKNENRWASSYSNVIQPVFNNYVKNNKINKNNVHKTCDIAQKKLDYDFEQKVYDTKLGATYYKGKLLGKGGFAKCYEMKDIKTSKIYAGKIISKSTLAKSNQMEKILREVELHSSLNHINIVGFHSFFEDTSSVYMVLEMCSRKSLVHVLKKRKSLTEPEVRYYMHHLINGVQYIHGQKIIHRDLKLGNMLLNSSMQLKIADFGLATKVEFEGEKKMTVCGTPNYIAPEVLQKAGHSYEADIWAMGCVMYALLCGRPPFETSTLKETYLRIVTNKFSVPLHVSMTAKNLIRRLLTSDPFMRPTLERAYKDNFFYDGHFPEELSPTTCDVPPKFPLLSISAGQTSNNQYFINTVGNCDIKDGFQNGYTPIKSNVLMGKKIYMNNNNNNNDEINKYDNDFPQNVTDNLAKSKGSRKSASQIITRSKGGEFESVASSNLKDEYSVGSAPSIPRLMDTSLINNAPSPLPPSRLYHNFISHLDTLLNKKSDPLQEGAVGTPQNATTINKWAKNAGLCVTKWVDYSNKYGFGFQLSNGCVGILFNDGTKMLLEENNSTVCVEIGKGIKRRYTTNDVPDDFQKQTTLLLYFTQFMENHLISGGSVQNNNSNRTVPASKIEPHLNNGRIVFLKRWFRTDKAVVMYLTDGTLQVNFFEDHTKVILNSNDMDSVYVTLVDSQRQASTYALKSIPLLGCTADVLERLQYTSTMIERVAKEEGEGHLLSSII